MAITGFKLGNREREIQANYEAFKKILPTILMSHAGKVALLKGGAVVQYFDAPKDAITTGRKKFGGETFSVQKVVPETNVELGWYSHT